MLQALRGRGPAGNGAAGGAAAGPTVVHLCFHGIGTPVVAPDEGESEYWIAEDLFLGVLDLVRDRTDVRLSFDDGFVSDVTTALPALAERGLSARFFPVMGRLGLTGYVDEAAVQEIKAAGMTFGVHGWTHAVWRDCTPDQLVDEVDRARRALFEVTGTPVDAAACPHGSYDRRVLDVLRGQGFTRVYTSDRAPAREHAWIQPRYSVRAHDTVAAVELILDRSSARDARVLHSARMLAKRLR